MSYLHQFSPHASAVRPLFWIDATREAFAAGDAIASVTDWSGSGVAFSQSDLAKRPLGQAAGINGRQSLLFDGTDDSLDFPTNVVGLAQPVTLLAVVSLTGWSSSNAGRLFSNGRFITFVNYSTGAGTHRIWGGSNNSGVASSALNPLTLNVAALITIERFSDLTMTFYVNGVSSGTPNQASGDPTSVGTYMRIGNVVNYTNALQGHIGEVCLYPMLSPARRVAVERALMAKWGIA